MVELAGIIILGILAQWVAWKFKIPAILPLILIGLLVGPISAEFITQDGSKWIEPIWNGTKGLFPGQGLFYFVSLAISIILFEGGLTLRRDEVRNVGPVISKLITLGSAITFFGAGVVAHYTFGLSWKLSFLFSALIIVTGPTVITPILRNIPLKKDISAVLKWEGILIDPIGALAAVLVFEFISVGGGAGFTQTAFIEFVKILLFGFTFGFTFAHLFKFFLNKKLIPHYLLNVVSLAFVLLVFVLSDAFAHESGLLSVVIMGMVLGNSNLKSVAEILHFKEALSVLLISILFILLSANINMKDLMLLYNIETLILFLLVVFVIRPIGVFLSTKGSTLQTKEKLFISWVGPRGIVAAGIASLFGSKLIEKGVQGAEYITPLVFMIVLGTVLLNATTARLFAKFIGVFLKRSDAILMVGANTASRLIGKYLKQNNRRVVLIDSNAENVKQAREEGIESFVVNIYDDEVTDNVELSDIGYILAMTGSDIVNKFAITNFKDSFGEHGAYRLPTSKEVVSGNYEDESQLFIKKDDFINLSEVARDYPKVNEIRVNSEEEYQEKITKLQQDLKAVPILIKDVHDKLFTISEFEGKKLPIEECKLIYVGCTID